jgi:hypothetical protein
MNSYYSSAKLLLVVAAIVSALVMAEALTTLAHYWGDTFGTSTDDLVPTLAGYRHGGVVDA